MTTLSMETLLEGLIPEIAYSGEKGMKVVELLKIVRKYHLSVEGKEMPTRTWTAADEAELEKSMTDAEMASATWAWNWLRLQHQVLINGDLIWHRLELSDVLALPEAETTDQEITPVESEEPQGKPKGNGGKSTKQAKCAKGANGNKNAKGIKITKTMSWEKLKKTLTIRPRIYPTQDLVWQTLTRHGVDYKKVPALEWACLQGIASAREEGILQSDLRRLVNQDKRSLPKRTDSLAQKGYIAKRTVVVAKMKTSRLWLIDFAPPLVEADVPDLDLSPETLAKDLEPVPWHKRWTGNSIDMDALGRTVVGIVKAWRTIRYSDLRMKLGVSGKRWQMKTMAKNCQRLVDMGVFKYTAAAFPDSRKVFKDCLKFVREPTADEWEKFLATGKKTSKYTDATTSRMPKTNALAITGKPARETQGGSDARSKVKRIFSGWSPEKPLAQTVFEVIRSAGPEGASNPQISTATIGYQHRRYMSGFLTKTAETEQPSHLKKFQVSSKLVRTGKTSAYMYSSVALTEPEQSSEGNAQSTETPAAIMSPADRYGFGPVRPRAFASEEDISLSNMSAIARKMKPSSKRRLLLPKIWVERQGATQAVSDNALPPTGNTTEKSLAPTVLASVKEVPEEEGDKTVMVENRQSLKRTFDEMHEGDENTQHATVEQAVASEQAPSPSTPVPSEIATPEVSQDADVADSAEVAEASEAPESPAIEAFETTGEPNEVEIPEVLTVDQLVLNARYNNLLGKLQVHQSDRKVTWLRAGRGLKKPVIIPIDDNLSDPTLQTIPGADGNLEKAIVFTVSGENGTEPASYVFIYDDEGRDRARWIQHETTRLKDPNAEVTVVDTTGAGAAMLVGAKQTARGKKGKRKRRPDLPPGVRPYVCSLCGGSWKNDIGLKYHLEKAQVPCNPNFDPASLLETSRKRRRLSPPPPPPAAEPEPEVELGPTGRPRRAKAKQQKEEKKKKRFRRRVRTAMRPIQGLTQAFRGLPAANGQPTGTQEAAQQETWLLERPQGLSKVSEFNTKDRPVKKPVPTFTSGIFAAKATSKVRLPTSSGSVPKKSRHKAPSRRPSTGSLRSQRVESLLPLPTAPATPAGSQLSADTGAALGEPGNELTPAVDGTSLPQPNGQLPVVHLQGEYPEPLGGVNNVVASDALTAFTFGNGGLMLKPFTPSTNYDRLSTEAKKRTAQAFDIINYLLDTNDGVFPGDKALFYAMLVMFLKVFPSHMPPTWKNFGSAIKAIETRKIAAVHTHMLKTERGRLQTCTLLVRTGVDPNGSIAMSIKQHIKEKYPDIYIPPAFSPTPEDMARLQEMDRKPADDNVRKPNPNGKKFRSRRKIEEVEVFNAPYYTNTAPPAQPKKDPLWIREFERNHDGPFNRSRTTIRDSSIRPVVQGTQPAFSIHGYGDIPVDPNIMGEPDTSMTPDYMQPAGGPSVLEAIKAYSLLPPKVGPRTRRLSYPRPLQKLPRELGRARNPGLASLPGSFFAGGSAFRTYQFVSELPGGSDSNTSRSGYDNRDEQNAKKEPTQGLRTEAKNVEFVWPSVLEQTSRGYWPDHSLRFFETYDGSFTLNGWLPNKQWPSAQNIRFRAEEMEDQHNADTGSLHDWVDSDYTKFCLAVNECAAWEQSEAGRAAMENSSAVPGHSFMTFSPPASRINNKPVTNLKWSEETQYDLETLPYGDLENDDDADGMYVENSSERVFREHETFTKRRRMQKEASGASGLPTAPQQKRAPGRPPKVKLVAIKTARELTSYPKSAEDLLWNKDDDLDWSSENVRLAAFIVVTTLLGGVDRVVDWGLMLRLVPDQTISQLRHYWCALKKDRLSTIVSLTDKFRRAFLKAYEKGEVPPIDFNNVLAYDWKSLIKWTTKLDTTERRTLPATREVLEKEAVVANFKHDNRPWREAFYHPQRSIFNKFQDATSEPLALPVDDDAAITSEPTPDLEMVVAMAWTRSLCVTPVEAYAADTVLHRRNSLFPHRTKAEITELMAKAVDQLQKQGVISKSSSKWTNGRRWRFNTRVFDALEKMAQQEKFTKAAEFKRELDSAFRAGETKKRITYLTNDGMILALLNLQANGRVRVETTGQPHVPMGHEPGNYETRKYTKKYMHFRLDVVPTDKYLYNDADQSENEDITLTTLRDTIRSAHPPTCGPGGAVPAWCDVFEKVDPERWLKYLSAVLITLASRGSMPVPELVQTLKPVIMTFEAELIVEWLASLGLLAGQLEGMAPAVMEWWWIAVEVQREGLLGKRE